LPLFLPPIPHSTFKPGVCPKTAPPGHTNPCKAWCKEDAECPGKQKCCKISCGNACLMPMHVKPGLCPKSVPLGHPNPCRVPCEVDNECPGRQKCLTLHWGKHCNY
uniref:WAP domain-containing protein n=1 Tax=Anolis carolinensis TaxID=28377 RepID=A0A803TBU3_ANOCA